jgi:hypothetical protein
VYQTISANYVMRYPHHKYADGVSFPERMTYVTRVIAGDESLAARED